MDDQTDRLCRAGSKARRWIAHNSATLCYRTCTTMSRKDGRRTDELQRHRNSELILSAALLIHKVDHHDLEIVMELEHIERRLNVLGKSILSSDCDQPEHRDHNRTHAPPTDAGS